MSGTRSGGFSITISAVDRASREIDAINRRIAAMRAPAERVTRSLSKFADVSGIRGVARGFGDIARTGLDAFRSISRVIAPLEVITGAASLAGLVRLTSAFGDFGQRLGFTAQRIGMSASALNDLEGAAKLAGISSGALDSGLQTLRDTMVNAIGGFAPQAAAMFRQLGVAFRNADGSARSAADVMPELADKIAAIRDPTLRARVATELFGSAGEALLPFLRRGSRGIAEYNEMAKRYAGLTEQQVEQGMALREAQSKLELSVTGLGRTIGASLSPVLTPLLNHLAEWIARNRDLIGQNVAAMVTRIGEALSKVDWQATWESIRRIGEQINAVVNALGGWKTVGEGVLAYYAGSWAIGMLAPFAKVLRLLALVPGSGVTAAVLAAAGIAALTVAGSETETPETRTAQEQFRRERGSGLGPTTMPTFDDLPAGAPGSSNAPGPQGTNIGETLGNWYRWGRRHVVATFGDTEANRRQGIEDYYVRQGWSRAQAAGLAANFVAESGGDPTREGDKGAAYGLAQWHPDRQAAFKRLFGHDIRQSTLEEQLAFAQYELTMGNEQAAGTALRGARTAGEAAGIVSRQYERPADVEGSAAARARLAEQYAGAQGPPANVGGGTGSAAAAGGLTVRGSAEVRLRLQGFPASTTAAATTSGDLFGPPKIEMPMPAFGG